MRRQQRIRGDLGDAMIEAALTNMLDDLWTGDAGSIGLTTYRSDWWRRMRSALEAAFEKLLDEPARTPRPIVEEMPPRRRRTPAAWIGTGLQILGVFLLALQVLPVPACYLVMLCGSLTWSAIAWSRHDWPQLTLQGAFTLSNVLGLLVWGRVLVLRHT